jgi:hypothetical protein
MDAALAILGIVFAAFGVWLAVRIVSRGEHWAKQTAVATIGLPLLYVASFGPACWLCEKGILDQKAAWMAYRPLRRLYYDGLFRRGCQLPVYTVEKHVRIWGDKRRIGTIRDDMPTSVVSSISTKSTWLICSSGSASPIDYEIESSQNIDHERRVACHRVLQPATISR